MNNDDPTLESELRSRFRRLGMAIDRTASPKRPLWTPGSASSRHHARATAYRPTSGRVRVAGSIGGGTAIVSVLVILFATLVARTSPVPSAPAALSSPSAAAATPAASANPVTTFHLSAPVWAMTFDAKRSLLWFPFAPSATQNQLGALDPLTGKLSTWAIPVTDYDGVTTQIAVGDDGAIWVAENYTLVRLDPTLKSVTSSVLPYKAVGSVPGALSGPTEGTGISSMTTQGDGVIIGRFDVGGLTTIGPSLATTGYVPLPSALAGPTSLARGSDGALYLFSGAFSTGVLTVLNPDYSIRSTAPLNAASIRVDGSEIVTSGGPYSGSRSAPGQTVSKIQASIPLGPYSLAVPDPRGGQTLYSDLDGGLYRVVNDVVVNAYQLPRSPGGHIIGVQLATSQPMQTVASRPADIYTMVDDPSGTTWCFVMATETFYAVVL